MSSLFRVKYKSIEVAQAKSVLDLQRKSAMEKLQEKFDGFWNCRDIYKLEKSLMRKLNVWPGDELVNGKLMALFLSNLIFIIVPEVCLLIHCFF
jgi:hypothetical protein